MKRAFPGETHSPLVLLVVKQSFPGFRIKIDFFLAYQPHEKSFFFFKKPLFLVETHKNLVFLVVKYLFLGKNALKWTFPLFSLSNGHFHEESTRIQSFSLEKSIATDISICLVVQCAIPGKMYPKRGNRMETRRGLGLGIGLSFGLGLCLGLGLGLWVRLMVRVGVEG